MKRFLLCFLSVPMMSPPSAAGRLVPRRDIFVSVCVGGETVNKTLPD